jgi:hydrogenase maturation protease
MASLDHALRGALTGKACVVGVGNSDLGDDGFGPQVAERLCAAGHENVIVAATTPERWMHSLTSGRYDSVLFVDAVEFSGEPGAAVLMDASEIETHFPQVSTHKISLGTLARMIRRQSGARVHLLGVRPQSLRPGTGLSAAIEESASGIAALLGDVLSQRAAATRGTAQPAAQPVSARNDVSQHVKGEVR